MKSESLYTFTPDDWKRLEIQYAQSFKPTFDLVTENSGSLVESQEIYLESFVYYTQLIELHGISLADKSEEVLYSFSRKLWIQKLRKRRVDVNFVKHHHNYLDMEDAFQEIDSIRDRSDRTAQKLAEIGEPCRTLLLDSIGRRKNLTEVAARLGFADEQRAMQQIVKGLRRLVELVDSKALTISDRDMAETVYTLLDPKTNPSQTRLSNDDTVEQTIVARIVAVLRSYVTRNERMTLLKELQVRVVPSTQVIHQMKKEPKTTHTMRPQLWLAASVLAAIVISALTSLGIVGVSTSQAEPIILEVDTAMVELAPVINRVSHLATAFQINQKGLILTAADAVAGESEVLLTDKTNNRKAKAKVLFVDRAANVAILQSEELASAQLPYRFAPDDARVGQNVYALACTTEDLIYEHAYLSASNQNGFARMKVETFSAGAPILNEQGQLSGMVSSKSTDAGSLAYVVHGSVLRDALNRWASQSGQTLELTTRNRLFYSDRAEQVEKIKPHLFEITYYTEEIETR